MDSLTHLVMGHTLGLAAAGAAAPAGTGAAAAAYWGALVGNSLPDVDVPAGYLMGRGWAFHRKYTHTVPGVLLLSAAAAGAIALLVPGALFGGALAWALAGCGVHVLLDCHNRWGTRALWPFTDRRLGWGVLFILDPFILAVHMGAAVGGTAAWGALAWAVTAAYIGLRWLVRLHAARRLGGAQVMPYLAGWRYILETPEQVEFGRVGALRGRPYPEARLRKDRHPAVAASRAAPEVAAFLARAGYPVAQAEPAPGGWRVLWTDLYGRWRVPGARLEVFVAAAEVDDNRPVR